MCVNKPSKGIKTSEKYVNTRSGHEHLLRIKRHVPLDRDTRCKWVVKFCD